MLLKEKSQKRQKEIDRRRRNLSLSNRTGSPRSPRSPRIPTPTPPPPTPPPTHPQSNLYFLLACHGNSTTADNIRYATITNIRSVSYVAPAAHVLRTRDIDSDSDLSIFISAGNIAAISEEIHSTAIPGSDYREINLPPLLFSPETDPASVLNNVMGFYLANNTYTQLTTLLTNEQLKTIVPPNPSGIPFSTFSQIEKTISQYVRQVYANDARLMHMKNHNIHLRFFCCRSYSSNDPDFRATVSPQPTLPPPIIVDKPDRHTETPDDIRDEYRLDILKIPVMRNNMPYIHSAISPVHPNWSPLIHGISYQGCGLNLLASYDVVPYSTANDVASIIYKTGTSIYTFMDYVASVYEAIHMPVIPSMCAYKFNDPENVFTMCKRFLTHLARQHEYDTSYSVPIKIYWTDDPVIETGHFVGLSLSLFGVMYLWDPQSRLHLPIPNGFSDYVSYLRRINPAANVHRVTVFFTHTPDFYESGAIRDFITRDGAIKQKRSDLNLLWGGVGEVGDVVEGNEITKREMDKLNNIKYELIRRMDIDVYIEEEFNNCIPKEYRKNFIRAPTDYDFRSPLKTKSLSSMFNKKLFPYLPNSIKQSRFVYITKKTSKTKSVKSKNTVRLGTTKRTSTATKKKTLRSKTIRSKTTRSTKTRAQRLVTNGRGK
jgi:hypothetical protein